MCASVIFERAPWNFRVVRRLWKMQRPIQHSDPFALLPSGMDTEEPGEMLRGFLPFGGGAVNMLPGS